MLRNIVRLFVFLFLFWAGDVHAANRFAVCTVTCTWDASSTAMWSTSTGGATGAPVPGASDDVIFDAATCVGGVTCTATVNTTVSVISITNGACTALTAGCILDFSANNNNVTVQTLSISGSGTRTLNLGNGTWTITGTTGNVINATTTTNLTFNANSSTVIFSATTTSTRTFQAKLTWNIITIAANTSGGVFTFSVTTSLTVATLNITGPEWIQWAGSGTTITNAFAWSQSATTPIMHRSNTSGTAYTITCSGTSTMTYAGLKDMTFSGCAPTANNSFNYGNNSNVTINGPTGGGGGGSTFIGTSP